MYYILCFAVYIAYVKEINYVYVYVYVSVGHTLLS